MYKRAREAESTGEIVTEVPMRMMTVYEAELLSHEPTSIDGKKRHVVTARFKVASGVYIRSLAVEFGRIIGTYPSTIQSLRRTKIGEFNIEDATQLEDF